MRAIRVNRTDVPQFIKDLWFEQLEMAQNAILDRMSTKYKGEKITVNDSTDILHGQEQYESQFLLRRLYHNKCAYCESIEYRPDIEHYRPKKNVSDGAPGNKGYYWLCYSWHNLFPSCPGCNRAPGKLNQFPVAGTRLTEPPFDENLSIIDSACFINSTYLLSEKPLLLNPEIHNPVNYLSLNWNGKLENKDLTSEKGSETIRVCDLNRGNLIEARATIINDYRDRLIATLTLFRKINNIDTFKILIQTQFEFLSNRITTDKPYSFVFFSIYNNFEDFLDNKLNTIDPLEKQTLIKLFEEFKKNNQ